MKSTIEVINGGVYQNIDKITYYPVLNGNLFNGIYIELTDCVVAIPFSSILSIVTYKDIK